MTAASRFRLFGRPNPAPAGPPQPSSGPWGIPPAAPPPIGAGAPLPATRSAMPVAPRRDAYADPPTDPHGFPPVPGPPAVPDPAEAAALAGAFAVDYLSWDEDEPSRRARVLLDYLAAAGREPARLGWSGRGRQRADFALPGLVRPDGDGRVLVDVRVRVTPYRAVGEHAAPADVPSEPDVLGVPSAAPAPTGRGWRSLASCWIRLSVPVTFDGRRLVVDTWDETLGEEAPPPVLPRPRVEDDPLVEPRFGGAP